MHVSCGIADSRRAVVGLPSRRVSVFTVDSSTLFAGCLRAAVVYEARHVRAKKALISVSLSFMLGNEEAGTAVIWISPMTDSSISSSRNMNSSSGKMLT